jgi:hypothetical protein
MAGDHFVRGRPVRYYSFVAGREPQTAHHKSLTRGCQPGIAPIGANHTSRMVVAPETAIMLA